MSSDAAAGPPSKRDHWDTAELLRLPKRPVCLIVPFVLESKNSNRVNPFRRVGNVDTGQVGDHEERSSLHCLLHWTR